MAAQVPLIPREREILRVAVRLEGSDPKRAASNARKEVLKWVEKRTGGQLPKMAWDHSTFEHLEPGRNCAGERLSNNGKDIWAIRTDDPDKTVPQRAWTTEAVVRLGAQQRALFNLRLLVNSPEPRLDIEPAVPGFLHQIASKCRLRLGAKPLTTEPWVIKSDDEAERLIDTLIDPARRVPVFVLSVPQDWGHPWRPLVDPEPIAKATLGIATVVVLPAQFTWALTDQFGKQLSVFWGAIRIYRPGLTKDDDPYRNHPLFLADRLLTPEGAKEISARLRQVAATESLYRLRLGTDVMTFSSVKEQRLDLEREQLEQAGATEKVQLSAARTQIEALKKDFEKTQEELFQTRDELQESKEEQKYYLEEHATVLERAKDAEDHARKSGYRIQVLLQEQGRVGDQGVASATPFPTAWDAFPDWCEQNLVGQVQLSARSRRETKTPQFKDVQAAARCLLWLARDYRKQRMNGGDGDLRVQVEAGIHNDRCGADSFQFVWQGEHRDVEWHIKNGGNTHNPSRCLRIYYFWDDESQQVIIASMPSHRRTGAT